MLTIHRRVAVSAPPSKVYGIVDDARRLPELFPHLEVEDVHPLPFGGHRCHCVFETRHETLEADVATLQQVRGRSLVDYAGDGLDTLFRWTFTPHEGVTEVVLDVESEAVDEVEAEAALAHLKAIAEA
jgi:ribosome-associated toxin RatA of RatAB toxin-antitoxin module